MTDDRVPRPPRVLAVLPQLIPSTILTVVKPFTALHQAGRITADITLESWVSRRKVERADVVVFCRNNEPQYGEALDLALALGKPVVYELDDNLFELPNYYPRERRYLTPARLAQLEHYLRSATLVRVYSEPLRERVTQLNCSVVRVDGPVDWSLIPASPPLRDPDRVRIVYVTSRVHEDDLLNLFVTDLQRLLRQYHGRVEFHCWGHRPAALLGDPAVRFLDFVPDYDRFFRRFARYGFDIGLAPLRNDLFHRSKTNNKFREYAAARVAGVYSNVDVYNACVEDRQTGLLVSEEPGAWFAALSRLVDDGDLRSGIQERAFRYAREHYGLEQTQALWLRYIHDVCASRTSTVAARARTSSGTAAGSRGPVAPMIGAVRRALHLAKALRVHGLMAGVNRVKRNLRDWRLFLPIKSRLWFSRLGGGRPMPSRPLSGDSVLAREAEPQHASETERARTQTPAARATVIVVSFNTRDLLRDCLMSLRRRMPEAPVVVVDNASDDGSAVMVAEDFPDARLICNQRNVGFGAANNQALAQVSTEFALLLNSDAQVHGDIISSLARILDEHPQAAMVGCRLISRDGQAQRSARRFPSARRSLRNALALPERDATSLTGVDYVDSAAVLVRTAALREASGFDERFFLYAEDADLCRRLRSAGWEVLYDPRVSVAHVGGGSTRPGSVEDDRRRWEAMALFAAIHFGRAEFAAFFVVRALELLRQSVSGLTRAAFSADPVAYRTYRGALRELRWHPGYLRARARYDRWALPPRSATRQR